MASMTKQHFDAITGVLALYLDLDPGPDPSRHKAEHAGERRLVVCIACGLARELARFNPRFKPDIFLAACGVTPEDLA